ncbi:MAG: hypothetical protein AAFN70_11175 [Planctomycetota bacterium]
MALPAFLDAAQTLKTQALAAFSAATDEEQLESARVLFLGAKKGRMKDLQKMLGQVDKSDKPVAGQTLNATKQEIQSAFESAKSSLGGAAVASGPTLDPTLPGDVPVMGHVHPITQTIEHLPFRLLNGSPPSPAMIPATCLFPSSPAPRCLFPRPLDQSSE